MHSGVKQARQDEAMRVMAESSVATAGRLEAVEKKLDRVLALLEQHRPGPPPQQQRGGR